MLGVVAISGWFLADAYLAAWEGYVLIGLLIPLLIWVVIIKKHHPEDEEDEEEEQDYFDFWYRDVRWTSWVELGADASTIMATLNEIEQATGARSNPEQFDTIIEYGEGHWTYEWNQVAEFALATAELAAEEGLVSLLAEPLSVREKVIGVLACYTTKETRFSDKQQTLLATLANQTALAIENAQLITNAAVVREMHHRIKNNLQTVAMLMQLQLGEAHKLNTREVLETSIARIHSIATVHEVLSERGFRLVEVRDVLERIVAAVMIRPSQDISILVQGEQMSLPSRAATAVAFVVNELVQNAIEHGFADRDSGEVSVTLSHTPQWFLISVADNGRGLPVEIEPNLGLELVETLVKDDLNGDLSFVRLSQGTSIDFRIPRSLATPI